MPRKVQYFSAPERADLWRRWKAGDSLSDIARALNRKAGTVHGFIRATGGIAPQIRTRNCRNLSTAEREEISRGISAGLTVRSIARNLRRSASTISRELARNGGHRKYRATDADARAWLKSRRPKDCKLATQSKLRRLVSTKLSIDWSPEQISGWLDRNFHGDSTMQLSHETIYRSLYVQARGVLKKELMAHLRSGRMMRRSKHSTTSGQPRGQIIDAVSIRDRPVEVDDRSVPGHWEGDLIVGTRNSRIATLVERCSRFTMLVKLEAQDANYVAAALARHVRKLPIELRRSLTWDRGTEMAQHRKFSIATDVAVYFCDPQSPWQRGTNENTNRLLRQYFPKGVTLEGYQQADLNEVARKLNERPRKILGFRTPCDVIDGIVALTG